MNVKDAKERISKITDICGSAYNFCGRHTEIDDETWFIDDMIAFLGDYKKVLENAINNAELNI